MTKRSGLAQGLWVAGVDVSGDTGSIDTASGGNSPLGVTGIDKSAPERLGGKRDGNLEWTSYFNDAVGQEHLLLRQTAFTGVLDWDAAWIMGSTIGEEAFCIRAREVDYAPTRAEDGSFTFKISMPANGFGAEWGRLLTAGKRTDSTATNGTSLDMAADAPGDFGAQAYLHVFAFTGTSVTFGARPMRALSTTTTVRRPGKRLTATVAPRGNPTAQAKTTAVRLTRRLSSTMSSSLGSPPATSRSASAVACERSLTALRSTP